MGMQGSNAVTPKPQVANAASGPAHAGGTADPQGINFAMQKNMGHFHPGQMPVSAQMNPQLQQPPMVPGGMMANKMGSNAAKQAAFPLSGLFKSVPKLMGKTPGLMNEAKNMGTQAASHAMAPVTHTGPITGTSIRNVINHGGPPAPTHIAPTGPPIGNPLQSASHMAAPAAGQGAEALGSVSYGTHIPPKPSVTQSVAAPVWKAPKPTAGGLGQEAAGAIPPPLPPTGASIAQEAATATPGVTGPASTGLMGQAAYGAGRLARKGVNAVGSNMAYLGGGTAGGILGAAGGDYVGDQLEQSGHPMLGNLVRNAAPVAGFFGGGTAGSMARPGLIRKGLMGAGVLGGAGATATAALVNPFEQQGVNPGSAAGSDPSPGPGPAPGAPPVDPHMPPGADPSWLDKGKAVWDFAINGQVDPSNPAVQQVLSSPEGHKMIASGLSNMPHEQKMALAKEFGGPLGEALMGFTQLPVPMQMLLSVGIFMGLGGLLGGQGGAMAGGLAGLAPVILANLPAISKQLGIGGEDSTTENLPMGPALQ
jgi:hypothetical protein